MSALIEKIQNVLRDKIDKNAIFELQYNEEENVSGYVISDTFENKNDGECQNAIWAILRSEISEKDRQQILFIFNETKQEHSVRVAGYGFQINNHENNKLDLETIIKHKFWHHKDPWESNYWGFVDIQKDACGNYKSMFIFTHDNSLNPVKVGKTSNALIFNYTKNILEFMELKEPDDIYSELFEHAYNQMCSEIRVILMDKYMKMTENGYWSRNNPFSYVYEKDHFMHYVQKKDLIFSGNDINLLKPHYESLEKSFAIKNDLAKAIECSKIIQGLR